MTSRTHLSSELGFSREHRDTSVRRIGWVASETRTAASRCVHRLLRTDEVRKQIPAMIEPVGGFILVHVATSLAVCERRDRTGVDARARVGLIPGFTGISDPYEPPDDAALRIDTEAVGVDHAPAVTGTYLALASRYGLAVTGGSDFHGAGTRRSEFFGRIGLPLEHYAAFAARHGVPRA